MKTNFSVVLNNNKRTKLKKEFYFWEREFYLPVIAAWVRLVFQNFNIWIKNSVIGRGLKQSTIIKKILKVIYY